MREQTSARGLVLRGHAASSMRADRPESMIDHLGLEKEQRARIQLKYYDAGHMMYVHEPSLKQWKCDIGAFYDATAHP